MTKPDTIQFMLLVVWIFFFVLLVVADTYICSELPCFNEVNACVLAKKEKREKGKQGN